MIYVDSDAGPMEAWEFHPPGISLLASFEYLTEDVEFVAVQGDIAAVSGSMTNNIVLYDICNPLEPEFLSELVLAGATGHLNFWGSYLYILCGTDSVAIVNASNPSNPYLCGAGYLALPSAYNFWYMASNENLLYISSEHRLRVYSLDDPEYPQFLNSLTNNNEYYNELMILNDCLIANAYYYVHIFATGQSFQHLSQIDPYGLNYFIAGQADTLIAGGNYGFEVYSIEIPANPLFLDSINFSGDKIWSAAFDGNYLYGNYRDYPVPSSNGLAVFSILPGAANIEMVEYMPIMENSSGEIMTNNNLIYFAQGGALGIYYYGEPYVAAPPQEMPLLHPSSFLLHPSHPNPFNASTVLSYQLPVASSVRFQVYDTAGRLVATLVNAWKPAGKHQAIFDGSDLPSGIYLARLTAGDYTSTQKLVLLK